jgi:hemerythrin
VDQLAWNPEWETGFSDIDEQHQRMLREFNDFLDAVQKGIHRDHIKGLLEFLIDYLDTHCEEEELQMRATGYPRLVEHKADHDQKRARARTLLDASSSDPETMLAEVLAFVVDWMENHIKVEDKLMARHLVQFARRAPGG